MQEEASHMTDAPDFVIKNFGSSVKAVNREARTADFIITTGSVDRDNDVINPAGWETAAFEQNPLVLWMHSRDTPPIGRSIRLRKTARQIRSRAQFATAEQNPLAESVFQLLVGGFLKAASVGFRPLEFSFDDERGGINFMRQELTEWSVVTIPANADAILVASAQGYNINPMKDWICEMADKIKASNVHNLAKVVSPAQTSLSGIPDEVAVTLELMQYDPDIKDLVMASARKLDDNETLRVGSGDAKSETSIEADEEDSDDETLDITRDELKQIVMTEITARKKMTTVHQSGKLQD
jgi:HK97 family phage prohead protease